LSIIIEFALNSTFV